MFASDSQRRRAPRPRLPLAQLKNEVSNADKAGPSELALHERRSFSDPDTSSCGDSPSRASSTFTNASSSESLTSHSETMVDELNAEMMTALSLSPAPSAYSLTESLREQSKHFEFGREVNSFSDVYRLPADTAEILRLDKQHSLFKDVMGDYAPPVRSVLERDFDNSEATTAVLDIGCGSGAWIVDVAREFPHISCKGVDLVPMPAENIPINCSYEVDDVNLGLDHFAGEFDVVHARLISSGIRDYSQIVNDSASCLRAGGAVDFMECDFRLYDLKHRRIVPTQQEIWGEHRPPPDFITVASQFPPYLPTGRLNEASRAERSKVSKLSPSPFIARWFAAASQAVRKRGGHMDAAEYLEDMVRDQPLFEDIHYREFWLPYGPWMRDRTKYTQLDQYERLCTIGEVVSEDILEFLRSGRPLLLSAGFPEKVVNELETQATSEVRESCLPLFFRMQNVYAQKRRFSARS